MVARISAGLAVAVAILLAPAWTLAQDGKKPVPPNPVGASGTWSQTVNKEASISGEELDRKQVELIKKVSGYFNQMLEGFGMGLPLAWSSAPFTYDGHQIVSTGAYLNVPAVAIIALMSAFLISGITQSKIVNNIIVSLKVLIVLAVIVFGFQHVNPEFWSPMVPERIPPSPENPQGAFGISGIFAAASVIFFAYIGFEAVSTAAQEAKNPQKTMPIGILASLGICTVLYILMALVITGMAPFQTLNNPAPVATALANVPELAWMKQVVNIGVAVGLGSTILSLLYGQSRILYAMTREPYFKTMADAFMTDMFWKN